MIAASPAHSLAVIRRILTTARSDPVVALHDHLTLLRDQIPLRLLLYGTHHPLAPLRHPPRRHATLARLHRP